MVEKSTEMALKKNWMSWRTCLLVLIDDCALLLDSSQNTSYRGQWWSGKLFLPLVNISKASGGPL